MKTYDSKQQRTQTVLLACVAVMLRVDNLALETNLDKTIITTTTDAVAGITMPSRPECTQAISHEKGTS